MSTVTPEPDEAQHRLAVAEGLLLSLGSGPLSLETARAFLGGENLSIDECVVQLERFVEEAKKTPLRSTEGPRKGAFHGMHGRERAVRKRALLPEGAPASRAFPTDPTGTHSGPPPGTENERDDDEADTDPSLKRNSAVKNADIPVSGHDPPTPSYLFVGYPLSMSGLADDPEGRKKLREERIARVLGLVEGDHSGSGTTDAAATEDAAESLTFTKPPNLRDAGDAWESCRNCVFFNKERFCNKYGADRDGSTPDNVNLGAYPVLPTEVCDSHSTLTPPDVQGNAAQKYKDRGLNEARIRETLGLEELWSDAAREAALAARKARVGDLAPGDHVHLPAGGVHTVIRHTADGHTWVRHDASGERVRMASDRVARVSAGRLSSVVESADLSEVKSDAYPDLNRTADPDANWVSKTGGLPRYIERIAKHVHYEYGKDISRAIQIAVGVVQRWCSGGQASAHGVKAGTGGVTAATRAKACAAVAEWDAKRTAAKAGTAAKNAVKSSAKKAAKKVEEHGFWALSIAEALTLVEGADWEEARDGTSGFIPPSIAYSERIIREVDEAYSDWDEWPGGFSPEAMKAISEGELELDGATCEAYGLDASIAESSLWDSARHPRGRGGEWSSVFSHMDRFKARRPRTANVLASIARAEQKPAAPRAPREIDREIERQGEKHGAEHPSSLEDVFAALTPVGPMAVRAKRQQSSGDDEDFTVDHAIGQVVSKFPNVSDWSVDGPKEDDQGKHWMLHVKLGGGEEHHIRVGADGKVGTVEVPTQTPKPAAAPSSHKLYSLSDLEPAGHQEKPYHMDDDAFFLGHDGVVYQKLESGSHLLNSKKGTPLAGVRIRNHETGTEKVAPAFAVNNYYDVYQPKGTSPSGPPAPAPSADDVFAKLLGSVKGEQPEQHGLSSFSGKHVVVTGKIEGKSRDEVEKLLAAKGAHVHSSVSNQVDYLIMGDHVGASKVTTAKAKGVSAVHYEDVKHLIETREDRMVAREKLEEAARRLEEAADGTEIVRARARQHVLAEQFERRWLEEKDYSHAERMTLAAQGKALPNGSYPIEDEEDLHNATVLARSGHGDVAGANALIAKRAAELGVESPLKKAAKAAV